MARPAMKLVTLAAAAALVLSTAGPAAAHPRPAPDADGNPLQPGVRLFVNPHSTTVDAMHHLQGSARADAHLLAGFASATWFTDGTPRKVQNDVAKVTRDARKAHAVPVLVAYYLPNRDCGQYSAGGAQSTAQYEAWIDGLARGIGDAPAAVILEPDGLGLIPNYVSKIDGSSNCTIAGANPADRFTQLNYAVDKLKKNPHTSVYLDATHTGWQNVGESAQRLLMAGVQRADGFFLNVSNYQFTPNLVDYGRWVSSCIALAERDSATDPTAYDFGNHCGNQYWNGGPATTWSGAAMDNAQVWSSAPYSGVRRRPDVEHRGHRLPVRRRPRQHPADDALRHRHQPQRRRPVDRRHPVPGPPGLVQPARPGARHRADDDHGQPAGRRVPVDQGAR